MGHWVLGMSYSPSSPTPQLWKIIRINAEITYDLTHRLLTFNSIMTGCKGLIATTAPKTLE
ncbi:hypothetical protein COO91_05100 [Nostoc flagelliforme CCNUN1]|uniref:Uncharacterized protein n=1 Tax=Nostoc flagelliforme CCNUN1 TaxID=2038116 RepID=A0A2K8SUH8_9NOSO|nr:hypothetical protein COO91_05100 [Nostoc flagelliforme CCNUN1]